MAISQPTGFPTSISASGQTTATVVPVNLGDVMIVTVKVSTSTTIAATSASGGGCASWAKIGTNQVDSTDNINVSMFIGTVTTTGSATLTITFNSSNAGHTTEIVTDSKHLAGATWSAGTITSLLSTAVSNLPFPSITSSAAANQVYVGYERSTAGAPNTGSGTTAGFTYSVLGTSNLYAYNNALSPSTIYAPTCGATGGPFNAYSVGVILTATPPPIAQSAGFPINNETTASGSGPYISTITANPQAVGDLIILTTNIHSQTISLTGVTHPNCGTFYRAFQYIDSVNGVITEEIWYGIATATGSGTLTATWSSNPGALTPELICDSYTSTVNGVWQFVAGNGGAATGTTAVNFPSVKSNGATYQLYWGYAEETAGSGAGVNGTPAGFTYFGTANGNLFCSNPALTPNTSYAPSGTDASPSNTTEIAAIFARAPAFFPNRRSNIAVQRASSR